MFRSFTLVTSKSGNPQLASHSFIAITCLGEEARAVKIFTVCPSAIHFFTRDQHRLNGTANFLPARTAQIAGQRPVQINANPRGTPVSGLGIVRVFLAALFANRAKTSVFKPERL